MKIYSLKAQDKQYDHPILFIHGLMHAAWCWEKYYMPYFQKAGFDVYAIDLSNHGDNQKKESLKFTTLGKYVEDLEEAVNHIGEDCILLGHSMGGMIIQKYLVHNTCHKAILLTPVPPKGIIKIVLKLAVKHPINFLISNVTMSLLPLFRDIEVAKYAFFGYTMEKNVAEESFKKVQDESFLAFLSLVFPFLKKPKNKVETLVVGAKNDNSVAVSDNIATAKFHKADLKIFDNMAHDMMLEKDWQKPADFIIDWIFSNNNNS